MGISGYNSVKSDGPTSISQTLSLTISWLELNGKFDVTVLKKLWPDQHKINKESLVVAIVSDALVKLQQRVVDRILLISSQKNFKKYFPDFSGKKIIFRSPGFIWRPNPITMVGKRI